MHNSLSWIDSSKMSCLVSNVCLAPGFFTCTAWLTVDRVFQCHPCSAVAQYEKGCVKVRQATSVLWPSMLLPTPLSLPKHSIPPQPSPRLKENTHRIYQRLESEHGVREEWMFEIIWHWNNNSLSLTKMVEGFRLMCPFCTFMTRDSSLGIPYFSIT